jgi:hypothetical protein
MCNGISFTDNNKYGRNDSYIPMIDVFCQGLSANSSQNQNPATYYEGELREVMFKMAGPQNAINKDTCMSSLRKILDECDNSAENVMGWKAGGKLTTADNTTYSIEPQELRHPAVKSPNGACSYNDIDTVQIIGLGWNGAYLEQAMNETFQTVSGYKPMYLRYSNLSADMWDFHFLATLPGIKEGSTQDKVETVIRDEVAWNSTTFPCSYNNNATLY